MISLDHTSVNGPRLARRWCAFAAVASLTAGCGGSDDTTQDATATIPEATSPQSSDPTTTTVTPPPTAVDATSTTASPSSTPAASTTTTSTTASTTTWTTTTPTSTSAPPTTTPTQTIPRAVQGSWRRTDADSISADDCRQESGFQRNFGQVLTVDADGFTYFESGGQLIEVIERDESRVDATFETNSGGPTTREERITLDAQEGGSVLIVNDAEPGIVRLLRCPSPTDPGSTGDDSGPLELEPFDLVRVRDAGVESIGCSVQSGQGSPDTVFFANGDAGFMVIDGESITLANSTSADSGVIPDIEADLTYSENGYAATFVTVGAESANSIESTEQVVTLAVATPDGRRTRIDGVVFCGV